MEIFILFAEAALEVLCAIIYSIMIKGNNKCDGLVFTKATQLLLIYLCTLSFKVGCEY